MGLVEIIEWVVWSIVLICGLWFAIGIRQTAIRGLYPPTWPTLILSFYLLVLPIAFLFLDFNKLHIVWLLLVVWKVSLYAGFIHVPVISKLLIWPAYYFAYIMMIGTGRSLSSPSKQSPWAGE